MKNRHSYRSLILCFVFPTLLVGCAGARYHTQGMWQVESGKVEEGLQALARAVQEDPDNGEYRKDLYLRKAAYIDSLLSSGEAYRRNSDFDQAEAAYRKILAIETNNVRARTGLDLVARDRRHGEAIAAAEAAFKSGDIDKAQNLLRPVLSENPDNPAAASLKRDIGELLAKRQASEPTLRSSHTKPVNIEFRDANVKMVFEALSRTTGVNFILDKDVRPDLRTSIFLKNASIEDAIELILQTSQLNKKILNSNTVLIYPNTPEKLKDYQELVLKSFYLQNADVKQIQNTLKTLLKTKDIVIDEKLNLLVMRDTPDAVRLAEKLVAMHDLAEPEVMLEVEVIEVQRSKLVNLGVQWPTQATLTPLASGSALTVNDLKTLTSNRTGVSISSTVINAKQELSDANLLANPRIRVRNREKAKVMVGDKIPVVTTTTTATGLVSDSVQYLDVGLKVDLEPDIHLQNEVAIKVGLEVSSLGTQITTSSGTIAYQIGTRNANTVLRLKDGETQILAGLINDEERGSGTGVPGLASLPILGRLFGSRQDSNKKTEIVLSITPHLVRNLVRPDADQGEFWSGSETTLRTKPLSLQPVRQPSSTPDAGASGEESERASNLPGEAKAPAKSVIMSWQGPAQVKVGDQFKLTLKAKSDGSLRSLPFQASYDPAAFQVVEISEGAFFKQNDGSSTFTSNVDPANGKFFVSATRSAADGAAGEDSIAVVTLRALSAKAKADITLLAASPLVEGDKPPTAPLPAPHSVAINP